MRVITFSQVFPAYHPRKGEPTGFVEKIWKGLYEERDNALYSHEVAGIWSVYCEIVDDLTPKGHTIRAGKRWKVGDFFSPRIWSGKPYASKQIEFAPPIEVKKVFDFVITPDWYLLNGKRINLDGLKELAKNDGLTADDLELWFAPYAKKGETACQVICWNENIEY